MGKPRTLANTVSSGGPLADGAISASEVSGLAAVATSGSYNDLSDKPNFLVSGTAITTNGQSAYEFTGIPASAKSIRLLLRYVSADDSNGSISVQLGTASGYASSGYAMTAHTFSGTTVGNFTATTAFPLFSAGAGPYAFTGTIDFSEIAPNVWVESAGIRVSGSSTISVMSNGDISLGAELTKIQIITSAGLFDGGTINILYS